MHLDTLATQIAALSEDDRKSLTARINAASATPSPQRLLTFSQAVAASAANPTRLVEIKELRAHAARCGVELHDDKHMDIVTVDRQMRERGTDAQSRIVLKALLYRAGMIPA